MVSFWFESSLGLQITTSLLCACSTGPFFCLKEERETASSHHEGTTWRPQLAPPPKSQSPNTITMGLGFQHMNLGQTQIFSLEQWATPGSKESFVHTWEHNPGGEPGQVKCCKIWVWPRTEKGSTAFTLCCEQHCHITLNTQMAIFSQLAVVESDTAHMPRCSVISSGRIGASLWSSEERLCYCQQKIHTFWNKYFLCNANSLKGFVSVHGKPHKTQTRACSKERKGLLGKEVAHAQRQWWVMLKNLAPHGF